MVDNPIQKLKLIFQCKQANKKETSNFKEYNHDQISAILRECIRKLFEDQIKIEDIHGLNDAGVDLICDDGECKVGIQIKSYSEIANSDSSFSGTVKRQIQDSKKHSLEHLFILLCGDANNRSQCAKINGFKSEVSQMNDPYVSVISPEYLIQIVKSPETIKLENLSSSRVCRTGLSQYRAEVMRHLNSDIYIERQKGYRLIDSFIQYKKIDNVIGMKLFEIFQQETNIGEQIRILNILLRGQYFAIRNDIMKYWLDKKKVVSNDLSGHLANYFSISMQALEVLLDVLESKGFEIFPNDKIISDFFVALRAQINNNREIKVRHFDRIKQFIEIRWHQKNGDIPIIGEIYEKITGRRITDAKNQIQKNEMKPSVLQTINGDYNIQVAGNLVNVISPKSPEIKVLPSIGSIGGDPLLKQAIITRFNWLGEEREKRFGKSAYTVMYNNFKRDFGIKKNKWTIIWTWPRECAQAIIKYLDNKFSNTIQGRIERAAKREDYLHTRKYLYKRETELLEHLGLTMSSIEVKKLFFEYFGVHSHTQLTHLQHWQWVCYLEEQVKKMEES